MMCSLGWALEHKGGHGRGIVAIGLLVFCKEGRKWFAWTFSNLFADVLKIDLWCLNTVAEYATALILMTWEVSPFEETKVKAGKEGPMNAVCGLSSIILAVHLNHFPTKGLCLGVSDIFSAMALWLR